MVYGTAYLIFVLPITFTVVFSGLVLMGALDTLERNLNMWPAPAPDGGAHDAGPTLLAPYDTYENPIQGTSDGRQHSVYTGIVKW